MALLMSSYRTRDGRVRIVSVKRRAEYHRVRRRRGGVSTLWHAFDLKEDRWIVQEYPTLRLVKKALVERGYCESERTCALKREE